MKRIISIVISILLIITLFAIQPIERVSAGLYYLETSDYKNKVQNGSKKKIKLGAYIKGEKALRWWTSNKKLKIVKRRKSYCVVKAKKPGKCYVRCIMKDYYGKKHKLKLKITIKKRSKVTYDHYLDLEEGMTYGKVKKILGKPSTHSVYEYDEEEWDEDYEHSWKVHYREDTYTWKNPFTRAWITVYFKNGIVTDYNYLK